ncbi:SocA family protein [Lacticaseibacillus paracasei]|uniref:Panacea domain-containing protein n=1 Tax=Lacticaseibacillus paracasei TaxID=1597 RepID=UPI001C1E39F8|nr:SocA family protein [Lacticaseibacillus paracasei]MBU6047128.1 SocA family protein [Lacticaseibacillus paracasei]MCL4971922.1 Panacea domain-containing protein [Lacticaseibacillus paracasei]
MLFIHLVALNRTSGRATAYHFASPNISEVIAEKKRVISFLSGQKVKPSISFQVVPTESASYDSVNSYNSYFEPFKPTEDLKTFGESIHVTQALNSVDVASYLERKFHFSSYTLQKMLYFVYSEFLVRFQRPPFRADFIVFANGPVDYDVYEKRRWNRDSMGLNYGFEEKAFGSKDGKIIIDLIDFVNGKYEKCFQNMNDEGSNLTHRKGTPWSIAHAQGYNAPITDNLILKYHSRETI